MSIVLVGAIGAFSTQNKAFLQQDLMTSTEENLRVGMDAVVDSLRNGAFGVPTTNVATWIPWVSGFSANPTISSTSPATVSVAVCSANAVVTLSAHVNSGATTLTVTSAVSGSSLANLLDTGNKRLILINDTESAQVVSVGSSSIQIDTDPTTTGNQGIKRAYPSGTTICRVDVRTYSIQTDTSTGLPWLSVNLNQGAGNQDVADGISGLAVATVSAGNQYQVTLTGRSQNTDLITGGYITRSLTSNVTIKH